MKEDPLKLHEAIVGSEKIKELRALALQLQGKKILHINSTAVGGGVAEILTRLVPLLESLSVAVKWQIIRGGEDFFGVTKAFHNLAHGLEAELPPRSFSIFQKTTKWNLQELPLVEDFIFVHDPQPIGLIAARNRNAHSKWIWRCHIDVSNPEKRVWQFLRRRIDRFNAAIFSMPQFAKKLNIPRFIVPPSLDPTSDKNRELSQQEIEALLAQFNLPLETPLVVQISRFDPLKDPIGVIEAFRRVRRRIKCHLVLAGGGASDDPEGAYVFQQVLKVAEKDPSISILFLPHDELVINALQRAATVVIQKSLREGFGLTVTEALWKKKPVIGSAVGGIPRQIIHNVTGILAHSIEGTARQLERLLLDPDFCQRLGSNGHEFVKENFLITRLVKDHLLV
ncbi:MAG: glycosyltransferase, partial [Candidatus Thorarchaeota archaeon]